MNFTDKIAGDLLRVDFAAAGKNDALRKIAAIAATAPALSRYGPQKLYESLLERETAVSTGIGDEVAIPHGRLPGLEDFVVFLLVAPKGVDFNALDKRKVRLFFVVFAPEDKVNDHLRLLARISRACFRKNIKKELINTHSPEILLEVIARVSDEDGRDDSVPPTRMKLLCMVLYYEEDLHAVLEYLLDRGIDGATVFESKGMGAYLSTMPLFASFLGFMREDHNISNTLITLIPADDEQVILEGLEAITGDLCKKQGAMLITLDVSTWKGTMSMI